ncbi:MAG: hypothetical protein BJ554DRAFT_3945, partial [Olpidium bornovanus]
RARPAGRLEIGRRVEAAAAAETPRTAHVVDRLPRAEAARSAREPENSARCGIFLATFVFFWGGAPPPPESEKRAERGIWESKESREVTCRRAKTAIRHSLNRDARGRRRRKFKLHDGRSRGKRGCPPTPGTFCQPVPCRELHRQFEVLGLIPVSELLRRPTSLLPIMVPSTARPMAARRSRRAAPRGPTSPDGRRTEVVSEVRTAVSRAAPRRTREAAERRPAIFVGDAPPEAGRLRGQTPAFRGGDVCPWGTPTRPPPPKPVGMRSPVNVCIPMLHAGEFISFVKLPFFVRFFRGIFLVLCIFSCGDALPGRPSGGG